MKLRIQVSLWLLATALQTAAAQSAAHARFHARVPAALRQSLAHAVQVGTGATASAAAAGLRRHRAAQDAAQPGAAPAIVGAALRVTPAQFGGDPTGATDSTASVLAAVATCINASLASTNGAFSFGSRDARGCTVDLEGGEYLISKPIVIPTGVSNMRVQTGSLVANPASDAWGSAVAATAAAHTTLQTAPAVRAATTAHPLTAPRKITVSSSPATATVASKGPTACSRTL